MWLPKLCKTEVSPQPDIKILVFPSSGIVSLIHPRILFPFVPVHQASTLAVHPNIVYMCLLCLASVTHAFVCFVVGVSLQEEREHMPAPSVQRDVVPQAGQTTGGC